ncbi:nucleotide exchange factor Sil1p [Monosporozyma servazzii]
MKVAYTIVTSLSLVAAIDQITLRPKPKSITQNDVVLVPMTETSAVKPPADRETKLLKPMEKLHTDPIDNSHIEPRLLQPIDNSPLDKEQNLFIPEIEWKIIAKDEILPRDGLDIRINLDTGLKEAKLSDSSKSSEYNFKSQFNEIYSLIQNENIEDVPLIQVKIDDLLEFVHDYKYGFDIISHEWASLYKIILNDQLPSSLREIVIRLVISAMRNNPPVIDYIRNHSKNDIFISQIFKEVESSSKDLIILKRFITLLDQYLSPYDIITQPQLSILYQTYKDSKDKQLNWKILEIVSKYYYNNNNFIDLSHDSLWFNIIIQEIQDQSLDEFQLRSFFNTLYNIKLKYDTKLNIPSTFLNWLNDQITQRGQDNLNERDVEQESFDNLLKHSRHEIFGNPMADRIKHLDDEL